MEQNNVVVEIFNDQLDGHQVIVFRLYGGGAIVVRCVDGRLEYDHYIEYD